MIVRQQTDGTWIASGFGVKRELIAEGATRKEAMDNWLDAFKEIATGADSVDDWIKWRKENTIGGVTPEAQMLLREWELNGGRDW